MIDRQPVAWRLRRLPPFADGMMPERELALDDLLDDPMTQLVMASDGVERDDVEAMMTRLKAGQRLRQPNSQRR